MRLLTILLFSLLAYSAYSQAIVKGSGVLYTAGAPSHAVTQSADAEIAIDTSTGNWYEYNRDAGAWSAAGFRVQERGSCSPPSGAPQDKQSKVVVNSCDSLYYWRSGAWRHLNPGGGGGGGGGGYETIQEEGTGLTQRDKLNFVGSTATAVDDGANTRTNVNFDADVNALASTVTNGLYARTGDGTSATRTITGPAAGITVTNGDGVSGNPTLALANDLAAVEGLSGTGIAVRTGTDAWTTRSLTAPAAGFTITNSNGVSGNPTFVLANDLGALEGLGATGIAVRTGTDTWAQRTITAGTGISVSNGNGVSGNPTITNTGDTDASDDITTSTSAGGDLSGTYPNPTVVGLQTRAVASTAPSSGQVLKWNGSNWAPANDETSGGGGGYDQIQEEGSNLTQRANLNFVGSAATASDDAGNSRTNVTFDADVNALASASGTGIYVRTGDGTSAQRTLTGPAAGITVSNGDGVSGNPTLALADDLAALEGLSGTGFGVRTAANTWANRTITAGTGISVTNGDGVSGNVTVTNTGDTDASDDITTSTSAGGDLTGTYPNPTIATNAVTNAKFRQSAGLSVVGRSANTTGDVADIAAGTDGHVLRRSGATLGFGTVASGGIADGAVTMAKINQAGATSGQVIKWNGSAWAPAADDAGSGGSPAGANYQVQYYDGGSFGAENVFNYDPTNNRLVVGHTTAAAALHGRAGNDSGAGVLLAENSSGNDIVKVLSSGYIQLGDNEELPRFYQSSSSGGSVSYTATGMTFEGLPNSSSATDVFGFHHQSVSPTSGALNIVRQSGTFAPTSGSATYTSFLSNPTINVSSSASGLATGFSSTPTLTSALGGYRAFNTNVNSGTGIWAFYGGGTAASRLGGTLGVGGDPQSGYQFYSSGAGRFDATIVSQGAGAPQSTLSAAAARFWNTTGGTGDIWYVASANDGTLYIGSGEAGQVIKGQVDGTVETIYDLQIDYLNGTPTKMIGVNNDGLVGEITVGSGLSLSGGTLTASGGGGGGYDRIQEEGSNLTQRATLNFVGSTATAADDAGNSRTNVTFDADVNALASTATNGLYARTGDGTSATRTITGPAAGITVTNGDGVSGNPTLALANDLAAVEGLSGTGIAVRTASDTWTTRTLTGPAAGITVTNGNGVSGNPTLALSGDLSAVEGLSGTGFAVRTAANTWANRTITAGTGISVTNGDGVSGNVTVTNTGDTNAADDIIQNGNSFGAAFVIGTNDNNTVNLEQNGTTFFTAGTDKNITVTNSVAATNTVTDRVVVRTNSTGTPAAGFGSGILFQAESSTTDNRDVGRFSSDWESATDASRTGRFSWDLTYNGSALEQVMKLERLSTTGKLTIGPTNPVSITRSGILAQSEFLINTEGNQLRTISSAQTTFICNSSVTNQVRKFAFSHESTASSTAGFGTALTFLGRTTVGNEREIGLISAIWTNTTDASRVGDLSFSTVNNAVTAEALRLRGSGRVETANNLRIGALTTTPTKVLGLDANNDVAETTLGPGLSLSSGTLNTNTAFGRATAQTAANTNILTITVGGADASYKVSGNILVTTSGSESFSLKVDYTDEGNTARSVTIPLVRFNSGAMITTTLSALGAVPYPSADIHIRAKSGTNIVVKTDGTFTGCTYNVEAQITRTQ